MNLIDLIHRQATPSPWAEGEKIPWDEPGFSERMLSEHLTQAHDLASRRLPTIDQHVEWLHQAILGGKPARILDLGCGPGLYANRLARRGHTCVGIDFSPASIAYAADHARADNLPCDYRQQDIRTADFGYGYDLVMLIFGEFNVFRPADAELILTKARQALADNGRLVLEVHTFAVVRAVGEQPAGWYAAEHGLFSDRPHLCLTENFWDAQQAIATQRYFIIDGLTGEVTRHAASMQAYTDEEYQALLEKCGFTAVTFEPSLKGSPDETQRDFFVITARKAE